MIMEKIRNLFMAGMTVAGLCAPLAVKAQSTTPPATPPVVVPHDGLLAGLPDNVKALIQNFETTRDNYLVQQQALLAQLKGATTPAEREQIRADLQANRQAFMDALKDFRDQLKDDLTALKGKISHEEFERIIDLGKAITKEGGVDHHRGH